MPFVIYVFTISAFALGLAEFVPIGLTDVMAQGLCVGVEQTWGSGYNLCTGASSRHPDSALTASWSRNEQAYNCRCVYCR
ncbi:hypothetical protein ACVXHB_10970 [Escherichia coli]